MNGELVQLALGAGFLAMWLRIEHRLTKLETHCILTHKVADHLIDSMQNKLAKLGLTLALALLIAAAAGCGSMIPKERKQQVAVNAAGQLAATSQTELTKQVTDSPPPLTVTTSGESNAVNVVIAPTSTATHARQETGQSATASDVALSRLESSIPAGVKLLLLAAGVAALFAVLWYARRSSVAAKSATDLADAAMARAIDRMQARAMQSTDPASIARSTTEVAALEKERGKLQKSS
jgi:hypothetical protein